MNTLIKIIHAVEQDTDLFCDCHGTEPVEHIYRLKDENGAVLDACPETYEEMIDNHEIGLDEEEKLLKKQTEFVKSQLNVDDMLSALDLHLSTMQFITKKLLEAKQRDQK